MKISVILATRIGAVNKEIAGTEGMFLTDLAVLKNKYNISAFARFTYRQPEVHKNFYPLFLIKITKRFQFIGKFYHPLEEMIRFISDLTYVFCYYIKSLDSQILFGYSCVAVALLPFKRKIIFLHTYEKFYYPKLISRFYEKSYYIFCSKYLRDHFINKYDFINSQNSTYLYNAIDKREFFPLKKKGISGRKIRLLYASAWVEVKGLHLLLEAMLKLPIKIRKRISLDIASSRNLWYMEKFEKNVKYIRRINNLLSKIPEASLMGGVKHENMNRLYNSHDFLIFPSTWGEPCSLSLIESVFSGIPVIAFKVGGNMEILSNKNSILLKSVNVQSLVHTLIKIANNKYRFKNIVPSQKNFNMTSDQRNPKFLKLVDKIAGTTY